MRAALLRVAVLVAVAAVVGVALVALRSGSDDPLAEPVDGQLVLHFDDDPAADIENSGSAELDVDVVTANGGEVAEGSSASSDDGGLRLPDYVESATSPKAIVQVRNHGDTDNLNPGEADFMIGADVSIDEGSESEDPANGDNGNNVMQRGLFEGAQYKLQVDHETASCRVKGSEGDVTVKSTVEIEAGHWYRLRCTREGGDVTLSVTDMQADDPEPVDDHESGPTGDLTPDQDLALSVGGKLNAEGGIVETSDQFNGLIDNVVLDIN